MDNQFKIIVSHPTGNMNVRALVEGLDEFEILNRFLTTVASFPGSLPYDLSHISFLKEFRRRSYKPSLKDKTVTNSFRELGRVFSSKFNLGLLTKHEAGYFSIDAVMRDFDRFVAKFISSINAANLTLYSYEDVSYESFKAARARGMNCLYDLPTGHWRSLRNILEYESDRRPDWMSTIPGFKDSDRKLARKDEELALANKVFVASSFTRHSLKSYPGELPDIRVIPYGFPPVVKREYALKDKNRKLQILYVGKMSQQKGIADLFDAVNAFSNHVELTLVGTKTGTFCQLLDNEIVKHNYKESLSHGEVLDIMRRSDLFIFPSLFDGFGLVVTEAMSQGTPVLASKNSCAPDVILDGQNGWVMDVGNVDRIKEVIDMLLSDRSLVEFVGRNAQTTAMNRPWSLYSQEMIQAILT